MGVSGQHHTSATLYPRGRTPVRIVQGAVWASELVWTRRLHEKSFTFAGDRTSIALSSSPQLDTILTESVSIGLVF
jgi:hypothetical protein